MADISSLNNENLAIHPARSEGYEGGVVKRGLAVGPAGSEPSGPFSEGASSLDRPAFRLTISEEASRLARVSGAGETGAHADGKEAGRAGSRSKGSLGDQAVSDSDQREVEELKEEDRRVRQHEQAHVAAGGRYVRGGAKYEYVTGPDGKRYATGGEVSVDLSSENEPRATIQKMNTIRRAALAPADPSAADRSIAATATRKAAEARKELSESRKQEAQGAPEEAGGAGLAEPVRTSPSETSSTPDSQANAVLKTGLLRAISSVSAPPSPGPSKINQYA